MKKLYLTLLLVVLATGCRAEVQERPVASFAELEAVYADPSRFEQTIQAFEAQDSTDFPPENAVLCVGSSSMRGWHPTIAEDLAPLTVIPRGFGGSTMFDALYFAERIVTKYKPRAILVYEGDNDIAAGVSPQHVLAAFNAFVAKVRATLPEARIYLLAIKPSIARWHLWPLMNEANTQLKATCEDHPLLTFLDIASLMLNESGEPRQDIFVGDNLHINANGYALWTDAVRPILVEREARYEE